VKNYAHKLIALCWSLSGLRFYWRGHIIFALSAALCSAILCAALSTGESLHTGLLRDMRSRLGEVRSGVIRDRGLFPVDLADRLPSSEAALMMRGALLSPEGVVSAESVNIFGIVDDPVAYNQDVGTVAVNRRAAEIIDGFDSPGWSYRFEKPAHFAAELPLGSATAENSARRFVERALPAADTLITADFDPSPASVLPVNIRVDYQQLAAAADGTGYANLLLSELNSADLRAALQSTLSPGDCGLHLKTLDDGIIEIKSREIFIPAAISDALQTNKISSEWALFHLVDDFQSTNSTNSTPYGFTAGVTPDGRIVPKKMRDDQIVVNRWLADKLRLSPGSDLTLKWRRFEPAGQLIPEQRVFSVLKIITMEEAGALKERMPAMPGLAEVDSCADWDIGMPMDEEKLADKSNEEYWQKFRETPKAVITHSAAKQCFGTFFGESMSVRVSADRDELKALLRSIEPERIGFQIRPLLDKGLAAAGGSTDFRALFTGMSCLLMVSALLLSGLTLALLLDNRITEPALFAALGIGRKKSMICLLAEWLPPAAFGSLLGAWGGLTLARLLVWSLSKFWHDAFAGASITFNFAPGVLIISLTVTLLMLLIIMIFKIRRFCEVAPLELLRSRGLLHVYNKDSQSWSAVASRIGAPLTTLAAFAVIYLFRGGEHANSAFFGAGFLLVISLMLLARNAAFAWLAHFNSVPNVVFSPVVAGVINACKSGRRGNSLVILLALGFFVTVGMLSMKHDPSANSEKTSSGSGGFQSIIRTTSPRTLSGGLEMAREISGADNVVPVRVQKGDEAGCMNMTLPQLPQLYGLPIEQMAALRAFEPDDRGGLWSVLHDELEDDVIPALAADQAMLQYSLKMRADPVDGDEISYPAVDGKMRRIRIVGVLPARVSILQGGLILNQDHFVKMFPGSGYRMWLCDYAPYNLRASDSVRLRYPEPGVHIESAVERLRLLGRMESTYLDMFLVLGALGLLLGVCGVALVIARSIDERRYEFAVLQAVGVRRRRTALTLICEYGTLTTVGVLCGVVPAMIAIQPAALSLNSTVNWRLVATVVLILCAAAAASVAGGAFLALRRFNPALLTRE